MRVFVVLRNADATKGRGPMVFDSVFSNSTDAGRYAEDRFNYYGHGAVAQGFARIIDAPVYESIPDWQATEREAKLGHALAKLSSEEQVILANYFTQNGPNP